jgi:hypothetical protein
MLSRRGGTFSLEVIAREREMWGGVEICAMDAIVDIDGTLDQLLVIDVYAALKKQRLSNFKSKIIHFLKEVL